MQTCSNVCNSLAHVILAKIIFFSYFRTERCRVASCFISLDAWNCIYTIIEAAFISIKHYENRAALFMCFTQFKRRLI